MSLRKILSAKINSLPTTDLSTELSSRACVAILLRGASLENLEVGYIRRSISANDRWSGQMAFPGGKREPADVDDLATAIRETDEEIGVQLTRKEFIGPIHDVQARRRGSLLDFFIRPAVFFIERPVATKLDPSEVADFFWIPLVHLQDPTRARTYTWREGSRLLKMPAVELVGDPPLWGLTYMMTQDLLGRLL